MTRGWLPMAALLTVGLLTSCKLGPNYKRPAVVTPPAFRNGEPSPTTTSLADTKWFDLFQDEVLKQLVETALKENHDVKIAAERVRNRDILTLVVARPD